MDSVIIKGGVPRSVYKTITNLILLNLFDLNKVIHVHIQCISILNSGVMHHGRRHDFGTGGAELEVGRKMCARLCAQIFYHTHQYIMMLTYSAYITAII